MKSQWLRYAVIAAFACALGALAHAGISGAMQSQHQNRLQSTPQPDETLANQQTFPGLEARLTSQRTGKKPSSNDELQNALLQKLWDVIDTADDLSSEEKSEARAILEEADPVLARIKKENQRAIEILKNPPRRVIPKPPAPAKKEEAQTSPQPSAQERDGNN